MKDLTKERTNICFILGGFQGNGGIGRVTSILANNLCDTYNVHTISFLTTPDRPLLYELDPRIKQHSLFTAPSSMTKALLLGAVRKVRNILKNEKIDIIIACGALFFPLAIFATIRTKTKCFCWEHINPGTNSDYKFQGLGRKFGIRFANKLIVLTKSAKKYYTEKLHVPQDKIVQIYNPILSCDNVKYNDCSKKIMSVGRLCYQKNFSQLLNVASKVFAQHDDWIWDIYGEGELKQELENKAKELSLVGKVNFCGQVSNLYDKYGSYAFMVMTSRYEGFPMSLLEGASHGLPLVSFNVPTGPDEIIENGENGFLLPPFSEQKMVESIEKLIDDRELRIQYSAGSLDISEKFNLEGVICQWKILLG